MNNKKIEVYDFYKKKYGPGIIFLFHVNDSYVSMFEDAKRVATIINADVVDDLVFVPEDSALDVVGALSEAGEVCKLISYRDDDGRFSLPDVYQLQKDEQLCEKYSL